MKKYIVLILILIVAINKSYSSDSCFVKMNQKYVLKTDSVSIALEFINDSTYILRSERPQESGVALGTWHKLNNKSILMTPQKGGGLLIKADYINGRIHKYAGIFSFEMRDEEIEVQCVNGKVIIKIDSYIFKEKNQ
jgi:hypothetical protein